MRSKPATARGTRHALTATSAPDHCESLIAVGEGIDDGIDDETPVERSPSRITRHWRAGQVRSSVVERPTTVPVALQTASRRTDAEWLRHGHPG